MDTITNWLIMLPTPTQLALIILISACTAWAHTILIRDLAKKGK